MNVALIGMSGAGKSFLGRRIAETIGLEFIDTDAVLEEKFGKELPEIIEALGESAFIEAEAAATIELSRGRDNLLISTGGSIIYSDSAMRYLSDAARIVYLEVSYEVIERRVAGQPEREERIIGLSRASLHELYRERIPLYEKYAHVRVQPENQDIKEQIRRILPDIPNT